MKYKNTSENYPERGAGTSADYRKYAENEKLSDSRRKLMNYFADWEIFRIFAPILTDHIMSNLLKKIN